MLARAQAGHGSGLTSQQLGIAGDVWVDPQNLCSAGTPQAPQACEDLVENERDFAAAGNLCQALLVQRVNQQHAARPLKQGLNDACTQLAWVARLCRVSLKPAAQEL